MLPNGVRATVCSIALMGLLSAGCADASLGESGSKDGAAALKGQTIDLVVPYDPGGGYDTYARLLAPYLEDCLGATIVVRNEPGAGGLLATNKTFVAPPDVPRMLIANTVGVVSSQLGGVEGAQYDARDFSWLGRISAEPNVLVVSADSKFDSFAEMRRTDEPVRFVATGPGSNEYANSAVLPAVYGFPAETVTGFEGSEDARAAVVSGDADAHILPIDSQIDGIEAGDVKPLLTIGEKPHKLVPDVPTVADFPVEKGQRPTLDALIELVETGRSLAAQPELPPETLKALRDGVTCALGKDELLAKAEKQKRDIDPLTGEQTLRVVDRALVAPARFRELVK